MAMADGYAQASQSPGVVNVHICCGLGNAMGMLYNAYREGTPLVLTAGQQDSRMVFEQPILAGDMVSVVRPWTKWAAEVARVEDLPSAVRRAVQTAMTPPTGPVFLSLPLDVQMATAELDLTPPSLPDVRVRPPAEAVDRAAAVLAKAANPIRPETHDIGLESWRREYDAYYREHGPDFEGVIALRPLVPRDPAENLVDRNKREIRAGFSFMLDHPGLAIEHTWIRIGYFFNPTSYLVRHMREDFYPAISGFFEEFLVVLALGFTLVLFVFFVLGATAGRMGQGDPYRAFLILMFLGTLAIYAVTGVQSRSRLPIEPLMAPLAADALLRLRTLGGRAWLLAAPVLIFMAYVWAKYLPLNYA